ncbi:MAG: hypothetical protein JNM77_10825 [Pseudonocardia sp.]|nr:hypothetical protein [Pseudonocardia sp.]
MDLRRPRGPRLRGVVTAALSTLLIAVGHVLAGGSVPDLGVLVVLFPLLTGAVVGVADRCRSTSATIATLAGGQYALHVLLAVLHSHPPVAAAPSGLTMFALHAVATLVVTVLLGHADRAVAAAGSALRRVLPRRPFVPPADGPLRSLRVAAVAPVPRQLALAAVPTRRGPPVGC